MPRSIDGADGADPLSRSVEASVDGGRRIGHGLTVEARGLVPRRAGQPLGGSPDPRLDDGLAGGARAWPPTVRVRVPAATHSRAGFRAVEMPPGPPGDEDSALRQAVRAHREAVTVSPGASTFIPQGDLIAFDAHVRLDGVASRVHVLLHVDARDVVHEIEVKSASDGSALDSYVDAVAGEIEAALEGRLANAIDDALALNVDRLTMDVKVIAVMLDIVHGTLAELKIDETRACAIDRWLDAASATARRICASHPDAMQVTREIGHFKPQAAEAFKLLQVEMNSCEALEPIAPRQRWRLFVDPAIVEAVRACGVDTDDNPLMAFLLDGEQPAYCLNYARAMKDALDEPDRPLSLARFAELAKSCAAQERMTSQRVSASIHSTPEGRTELADSIALMVDPYGIAVTLRHPEKPVEAVFQPGGDAQGGPRFILRSLDGGRTMEAASAQELVRLLTEGEADKTVELLFTRQGSEADLARYVTASLDDFAERLQAARDAAASPDTHGPAASDNGHGSGSSEAAPDRLVRRAVFRLYVAVCRGHVHANGTGRLANVLLNAHLAREGQVLSALHDLMTADGMSSSQGCDAIEAGQALVRAWRA